MDKRAKSRKFIYDDKGKVGNKLLRRIFIEFQERLTGILDIGATTRHAIVLECRVATTILKPERKKKELISWDNNSALGFW